MGNMSSEEERLKQLHFSQDQLRKLHKKFVSLDKDKSGALEPDEFFDLPQLANNPLVKRVIQVLDKNKDGQITFLQFVQGLSSLSVGATSEQKLKFSFQIYDMNGDGFISNGQLFQVLKMMVGSNLTDLQLQQLVDRTIIKADEDRDGKISFKQFSKMVQNLNIESKFLVKA